MTYNPSKPAPNDLLSDSQLDIQTNFSVANTSFGKNHFPFDNATTNNGKHKFVEMPNSSVIPAGLAALEGTLYTKQAGSESQLFYSPDVSTNQYQLTRTITGKFSLFSTNTNYSQMPPVVSQVGGWTYLPGGMILQYGRMDPSVTTTVKYPIAFTNTPYSVQITGNVDDSSTIRCFISSGTVTTTQFVVQVSSSSHLTSIYWMAIGV